MTTTVLMMKTCRACVMFDLLTITDAVLSDFSVKYRAVMSRAAALLAVHPLSERKGPGRRVFAVNANDGEEAPRATSPQLRQDGRTAPQDC